MRGQLDWLVGNAGWQDSVLKRLLQDAERRDGNAAKGGEEMDGQTEENGRMAVEISSTFADWNQLKEMVEFLAAMQQRHPDMDFEVELLEWDLRDR